MAKGDAGVQEAAAVAVIAVASADEPIAAPDDATPEIDEQIQRLFLRYDLDGSGTINSFDELEQLCCNLGYRLELELNPQQIDSIIADVKAESPSIEWDLPHFSSWFKATFNVAP